jgi:hypothetical protein
MSDATMQPWVKVNGSQGYAKLTSLVSGVAEILPVDPHSPNGMVTITFNDGKVAVTESTQADIEAAQDALAFNAARREGQAMSYDEFMRKLTSRRASGG